ncbi:hypothetical protein H4Q26_006445 [Puccinia striiformis f. sp. tritici PST-130]|nr:hypothetical protein H4Q26_006445 [Puccinia striiformis f. sp. tritici PST-130]
MLPWMEDIETTQAGHPLMCCAAGRSRSGLNLVDETAGNPNTIFAVIQVCFPACRPLEESQTYTNHSSMPIARPTRIG